MLPPNNIWDIIEIFNKVKPLNSPLNIPFFSVKMIAEYFEVNKDTVYKAIDRHKQLFEDNILSFKRNDLILFKEKRIIPKNTSSLKVMPYDSVLVLGVLLNDSPIADKIRTEIACSGKTELVLKLLQNTSSFLKKQRDLERVLRITFSGLFEVKKYVRCGDEIIDFVVDNNLAIECNENGHKQIRKENRRSRDKYIESQGYILLKYNPDSSNEYDLYRLINSILVHSQRFSP
jgi:very-short-patch-repair endonuclease